MSIKPFFSKNIMILALVLALNSLGIKAMEEKEMEVEPVRPLTDCLSKELVPGIYESDDIDLILSFPNKSFTDEGTDIVIFDIDQVLLFLYRKIKTLKLYNFYGTYKT